MTASNLRLLTTATTTSLVVLAAWYFYLHRYRVGTDTPDALGLTGLVAGVLSVCLFITGVLALKRGDRSPLVKAATVIGAILPGGFLLFVIGAIVLYFLWELAV